MKRTYKKIVCFMLALACIFTSVPTTAYASFATDSSQTKGGSKTYKFYFLEREVFKNVYCNQ